MGKKENGAQIFYKNGLSSRAKLISIFQKARWEFYTLQGALEKSGEAAVTLHYG